MKLNRADKSLIARWWFTADRLLLTAILLLMATGFLVSFAASPSIAVKLGLDPFHFVKLHSIWFIPAIILLFTSSLLNTQQIRRFSLIIFVVSILLMIMALGFGPEVKGARRWIQISGWSLQPSEFAKPAFVILVSWFFAEGMTRPDMPGNLLAVTFYVLFAGLLVAQPDIGQAILITAVWGAVFFLSGASLIRLCLLGASALGGVFISYFALPHVRTRLDKFFGGPSGDNYQQDKAMQSFNEGGWLGRGPGEGEVKRSLPDAHTDFTFAVTGEEFGIIACLLILTLFAFIVLRVLFLTARAKNSFACFAATGLVVLFGLQAAINMAVNTGLFPPKGMTLPFLSYGGSSFLGLSIAMGFVLGLTRRPLLQSENQPMPDLLHNKNAKERQAMAADGADV